MKAKEKPNPGRLLKIALVCLSLSKASNEPTYSQEPLDKELLERLTAIKTKLLVFQDLPAMAPVLAELIVSQGHNELRRSPSLLPELLKSDPELAPSTQCFLK